MTDESMIKIIVDVYATGKVVEELEKILTELDKSSNVILLPGNLPSYLTGLTVSKDVIKRHISELKGDKHE